MSYKAICDLLKKPEIKCIKLSKSAAIESS